MMRSGFSLIEALVAMLIASLALLAVFELQQQLAAGQLRYEQALSLASLRRDAIILTETVNPMAEPNGVRPLGSGRAAAWRAEPLTNIRPGKGYPSGSGAFEVRLYRVDVDILDVRGRLIGRTSFERLGWRKAAPPQPSGARAELGLRYSE